MPRIFLPVATPRNNALLRERQGGGAFTFDENDDDSTTDDDESPDLMCPQIPQQQPDVAINLTQNRPTEGAAGDREATVANERMQPSEAGGSEAMQNEGGTSGDNKVAVPSTAGRDDPTRSAHEVIFAEDRYAAEAL